MANHGFYSEFSDFLSGCSEFHGELITNALSCYFNHPDEWDCPEDGVAALQMLTVCDVRGFNWHKENFDPVNNPVVSNLAFQIGLRDWFSDQDSSGKEVQQDV